MKPAFYQVGKRVINRYEVREVYVHKPIGYPRATVTYKDGTTVEVTGTRVPGFLQWILDKEPTAALRTYMTVCEDDQG